MPRGCKCPGPARPLAQGGRSCMTCDLRAFPSSLPLQLRQMKEKRGLYPDKSVYTQQIGPGLCFGALALMLRFFFEVPRRGEGSSAPEGPLRRGMPWGGLWEEVGGPDSGLGRVPGAQQRHGACRGAGGWERRRASGTGLRPPLTARRAPAGVGPHLRPQLLPLRPGRVLRPAAAQGQQEGWRRGAARQAGLLHPVLCLPLTCAPPLPVPRLAGPSCPSPAQSAREKFRPHIPTGPRALGSARRAKCFPRPQLLSLCWVLGAGCWAP